VRVRGDLRKDPLADAAAYVRARISDHVSGKRKTICGDAGRDWRRELVGIDSTRIGSRDSPTKQRQRAAGLRAPRRREPEIARRCRRKGREGTMRLGSLWLVVGACLATLIFQRANGALGAQVETAVALTGTVTSAEEGPM